MDYNNSHHGQNSMTLEEIEKIIQDLRQQIPNLQMQLHQAEGYKQALVDLEKEETEDKLPKPS